MKLLASLICVGVLVCLSQAVPTKEEPSKVQSLLPSESQSLTAPASLVKEPESALQSPKPVLPKLGPKNNRKRRCFWGWWGYDDYYPVKEITSTNNYNNYFVTVDLKLNGSCPTPTPSHDEGYYGPYAGPIGYPWKRSNDEGKKLST